MLSILTMMLSFSSTSRSRNFWEKYKLRQHSTELPVGMQGKIAYDGQSVA